MDWSTFTLKDGKRTLAAPCVEVVAFSYAAPAANGKGFDHCLRSFAKRYCKSLKFYRTGDMKKFRAVDSRTLDAPYHWFKDEKVLAKKMLSFIAHSGDADRSMAPPGLDLTLWGFDDPPRFVFRMALPVAAADAPDDLVAFAQEALAEFPIENGHCGYSFLWHEATDDDEVCAWAGPLMLRHPGLGYGSSMTLSNAASKGVVAVSWLTFLGAKTAADLGGAKALKSAASPEIAVLPVDHGGVLLRAGKSPQLGDVNRHDMLPVYRAVGRLVSPRRAPDEALDDLMILGMSEEAAHGWLRRFFV